MGRGIAYKRHQNERITNKRYHIVKDIWRVPNEIKTLNGKRFLEEMKGHYKKFNLSCNCGLCEKNTICGKRIPSIPELKRNREDNDAITAGFESVA